MPQPKPMEPRQVMALSLMALEHVAEQNQDVTDWGRAAHQLRTWLQETRGAVGDWQWYFPGNTHRRKRQDAR